MKARRVLAVALALTACSGEEQETAPPPPASACKAGEWTLDDGSCQAAGLPPDLACAPGWGLDESGSCVAAGVPPGACGAGFTHDGAVGCEPILPASPCGPGTFAVPGDTFCHEVADCGPAPWGDVPSSGLNEYVDQSFTGTSFGSAAAPWKTIQEGIDNVAFDGAIVVVAAGSYFEDVFINRPVHLQGRCPGLVAVIGSGIQLGAINVSIGGSGSSISKLALRGAKHGLFVGGASNIDVGQVWVHDTARRGLQIEATIGPPSVTVHDSLIENNGEFGIIAVDATLTVERTAIRDTKPLPSFEFSAGLMVTSSQDTMTPASATIHSSLIERTPTAIIVNGATVDIDELVARDRLGVGQSLGGGIIMQLPCLECTALRPSLSMRRSLIERVSPAGILDLGGQVVLENSVIRYITAEPAQPAVAVGLLVPCTLMGMDATCATALRASGTIRASLIAHSEQRGVHVVGSDAELERVAILDSPASAEVTDGEGIGVESVCFLSGGGIACDPTARSVVNVRSSLIERSRRFGVVIAGSDATLEQTYVHDTLLGVEGFWGRGIQIQDNCSSAGCAVPTPSNATLRSMLVEGSAEAGIAIVSSNATIETSLVTGTAADSFDYYGDGIIVMSYPDPASATITSTRVEQSRRAGLASLGALVSIGGNALSCQAFDLNGESSEDQPYRFEDRGGNGCGCPDVADVCYAVTSHLEPPPPLPAGGQ